MLKINRKQQKGFALVQALFFMMFIMAIVSVTMMMSAQRTTTLSGERMALDAYPAAYAFLHGIITTNTATTLERTGKDYFENYPLSSTYIKQLNDEGISDPTVGTNLVLNVS